MPLWQQKAAAVAHALLYALLLAIPISGWLYSSATGVQVVYLGLVPLPDLVPKDKALAAVLKVVHVTLNFTMFAVVCLHAAAALEAPLRRSRRRARADAAHARTEANRKMSSPLRAFLLSLGVLLLAANPAGAQGVLVDKSDIRFVAKQMGVNVEGRFRKWTANVVFLPTALDKSKAEFDIDLASVDLASAESETELKGAAWFDSARFPRAHFASTSIKDQGGDKYEIAGSLSLKGVTKELRGAGHRSGPMPRATAWPRANSV